MNDLLFKALRDVGYDIPPQSSGESFVVSSTLGGSIIVTPQQEQWHVKTAAGESNFTSPDRQAIADWAKSVRAGLQIPLSSPSLSGIKETLLKRLAAQSKKGTEITAEVKKREGQNLFRDALLQRYNNRCPFSNISDTRLLVASHILPWSASDDDQRLDPDNGFLLNVMLDALFDKYIVTVNRQGDIEKLEDCDTSISPYLEKLNTLSLSDGNIHYLELRKAYVLIRKS